VVDDLFYPRTTIYNGNPISSGLTFHSSPNVGYNPFYYNGTEYYPTVDGIPSFTDKDGNYYPATPGLTRYFADQFGMTFYSNGETNHGQLYHLIQLTSIPSAAIYGGGVYVSYDSSYGGQNQYIDVWDPSTGDLRVRQYDSNGGEANMTVIVNYRQPVWMTISWS
jgi:hypothetical protein